MSKKQTPSERYKAAVADIRERLQQAEARGSIRPYKPEEKSA